MELVKDLREIVENAKRADYYLNKGTFSEREFMMIKIRRGRCFVVIKDGNEYKFYPSKFVGYKDNNPDAYRDALDNVEPVDGRFSRYDAGAYGDFDGRLSNKAIDKILECKCKKDCKMSEKFIEYCNKFGLKGSDKMKFWPTVIEL